MPETTWKARQRPRDGAVLAWLRLARIFQKIDHDSARSLQGAGLSTAQFDVLAQIGAAEGRTQQELADALLVTKGNVCQLLGRMEQEGLIRRHPDGRSNRLYLTDRGRALADRVVPEHEAWVAGRFAALSAEETAQLQALLRKLDHSLG